MKKKILAAVLAGIFAFGSFSVSDAMSRAEISAIKVSKSGNFKYWEKNSEVKNKLVEYVKDVTNKKSKNFIPVEDRIATFDMDGTILCETAPYYFEGMLLIHRTLYDKTYTPSEKEKNFVTGLERFITSRDPKDKKESSARYQASVFTGMTDDEYTTYIKNFIEETPVVGLSNLKWGEAFYLPMVEVIKYLQANDFKVYIVSGSDRETVRVLTCDLLNIPKNQIIGTDIEISAKNQGDVDGKDYDYTAEDYLIRGEFVRKNVKLNKVTNIAREIGKQPVLAFGNSTGDTSMLNYAINGNKYKSAAFFVLCDDTEREFGKLKQAEKDNKLAEKNGWNKISMRNDWKTIYGDNVKVDR